MSSTRKPQIFSFIDWYEPAYKAGGPVRSVANLAELLKEKAAFFVVCGNREIDGKLLAVQNNQWLEGSRGEQVYYTVTPSLKQLREWKRRYPQGVFHINGMYSFRFSVLPLVLARVFFPKTKVVVSPRGMLNSGALEIKSTKKKTFLSLARTFGLFKNVTWHATSQEEKDRIKLNFPKAADIRVLSNIPVAPRKPESRTPKTQGELRLFSVTRIVPIKRLETICKALSEFPVTSKIVFDIYGHEEDREYMDTLARLAEKIPDFEMNFKGSVVPARLAEKTAQYHLFCLPSANENFGHAIYEAFASACPVLISDQTPWRNLAAEKAGFDLPLNDLQGFSDRLKFFAQMDNNEWQRWSEGAFAFAQKHYRKEEWTKAYLALFAGNE